MRRLICCALLALGCNTNTTGEAGLLTFRYEDPDRLVTRDLETPIAAGAVARIEVRGANSDDEVAVTSATIDPGTIAAVMGTDGPDVRVTGLTVGTATLEVVAGTRADTTTIRVAETARVELEPLDMSERVLVGGAEPLKVRRESADGTELVGEAPVSDVTFEPESGGEVLRGPDHRVTVKYLAEGTVEIKSPGNSLTRTVVGLDQVAEFEVLPAFAETARMDDELVVAYRIEDAGGEALGGRLEVVQPESEDPAICTVRTGDFLGIVGFQVLPESVGTCVVKVRLGELEETVTVELVE